MVEIESTASIVRWFPNDVEIAKRRTPYVAVCSLFHLEPHHVYIYGMHGKLTKVEMAELFTELLNRGITKITAERKGRLVTRDLEQVLKKAGVVDELAVDHVA